MTTNSVSRWWYGIAATTLFGVLLYGFAFVFITIGPSQPASSDAELVIKVLSLAATATVGFVLYGMTAIYIVSFALDWWALSNNSTGWTPSKWYLLLPLVAVSNFGIPVIATPVVTVGSAYYLFQRSQAVGSPGFAGVL